MKLYIIKSKAIIILIIVFMIKYDFILNEKERLINNILFLII